MAPTPARSSVPPAMAENGEGEAEGTVKAVVDEEPKEGGENIVFRLMQY